jgi:hypothetical protein
MPLGRKHPRRSRDAPTGGIGHNQRADFRLGRKSGEVNGFDAEAGSLGSGGWVRIKIKNGEIGLNIWNQLLAGF